MWSRAERDGRELTAGERNKMQELIEAAKSQHSLEQQIKEMDPGASLVAMMNGGGAPMQGGGPGDRFIASKGYQQIQDASGRGQSWTTGPVEVSSTHMLQKGTLLETGAGGPGGGAVPPLYQPASWTSCSSRRLSGTFSASRR